MICGCSNNLASSQKMDDIVVSLLRNSTYSKENLTKEEIKLIDSFIDSEKYENKVINLSTFNNYNDISPTEESNTNGVYEENGKYYIKYKDLVFNKNNDSEQEIVTDDTAYYIARIVFDGKALEIEKNIIPILYDDTKNSAKYTYNYRGTATYKDSIISYYNSIHDDTGMRIIFNITDSKIMSINIAYDISNDIYVISNKSDNSNIGRNLIFISSLLVIVFFVIMFILKKVADARKF